MWQGAALGETKAGIVWLIPEMEASSRGVSLLGLCAVKLSTRKKDRAFMMPCVSERAPIADVASTKLSDIDVGQ